jgi:hypothetical protein
MGTDDLACHFEGSEKALPATGRRLRFLTALGMTK